METVLNLIWLAITLAGIWVWRYRWFTLRGNRRERIFPEAAAIICLIALLFPVISLTDDLHPEIVIAECASAKRNFSLLAAGRLRASDSAATRQVHTSAALMARPLARIELFGVKLVFSVPDLRTSSSTEVRSGRSPPSSL